MTARQANLLAAVSLALADRMRADVEHRAGRGGQAPAALAILVQQEGLSLEGLRAQLDVSQSATVRLVDCLVADGFLERRPGPDARTRALVLTRSGRARANRVLGARRAVMDEALATLSAAERTALERMLEKLPAALVPDRATADVVCRLCDLGSCPQSSCPVAASVPDVT